MIFTGQNDNQMKRKILNYYYEAIDILLKTRNFSVYQEDFIKQPIKVDLNPRMRSRAGVAKGYHTVQLNYRLLNQSDKELKNTFIHELAHIICNRIFPQEKGHGYIWKRVMKDMGETPSRTHSLDVSNLKRKRQKFVHRCNCREHLVGAKIHSNIVNKGQTYTCRACKTPISYNNQVVTA